MSEYEHNGVEGRSFLWCAAEAARLLDAKESAGAPEDRRAWLLAHAVRRPLLERAAPPEEFWAPLTAAALSDPDPGFCRWSVQPALYAFRTPPRHGGAARRLRSSGAQGLKGSRVCGVAIPCDG